MLESRALDSHVQSRHGKAYMSNLSLLVWIKHSWRERLRFAVNSVILAEL